MKLLTLVALCIGPTVCWSQERLPLSAANALELWQRYCLTYSDDYRPLHRFLQTSGHFSEVRAGWFSGDGLAFDIGFVPQSGERNACVVVFQPSDGVAEAKGRLIHFVYTLDAHAFENREGIMQFSVMAANFTLFPTYSDADGIVSLTLSRD